MNTASYSDFRKNLKQFLDDVFFNHQPIIINRKGKEDVVVISKSDYDAMEETFHLLKSTNNAKALEESITEYKNGDTNSFSLDDLKNM